MMNVTTLQFDNFFCHPMQVVIQNDVSREGFVIRTREFGTCLSSLSTLLETIASLAVIAGCQPSYVNLRYLVN